ncbi:MAG: cysteine desulfurase family protein [Pseudomonadota bacterium]
MPDRVYLDWNATAPLRPEARAAMLEAMDLLGNPSSVHAEGRAAKALVERARLQVADLVGCDRDAVAFTSGATEAAMLALKDMACASAAVEHPCVTAWTDDAVLRVDRDGRIEDVGGASTRQVANSETGVLQSANPPVVFEDAVQAVGKTPYRFADRRAASAAVSAHKLGGPKGVGALILRPGHDIEMKWPGGGQEQGRRSGTENVVGIAGFGAAAAAAQRDLEAGVWEGVARLRDQLEDRLGAVAPELILFGERAPRLPNTSSFAIPGWKGETQVMLIDLAGFAVSAGSACSSGKVKTSRVLLAMGFDEETAGSALRVSIGPTTTEAEITAFADAWSDAYRRWRARKSAA